MSTNSPNTNGTMRRRVLSFINSPVFLSPRENQAALPATMNSKGIIQKPMTPAKMSATPLVWAFLMYHQYVQKKRLEWYRKTHKIVTTRSQSRSNLRASLGTKLTPVILVSYFITAGY